MSQIMAGYVFSLVMSTFLWRNEVFSVYSMQLPASSSAFAEQLLLNRKQLDPDWNWSARARIEEDQKARDDDDFQSDSIVDDDDTYSKSSRGKEENSYGPTNRIYNAARQTGTSDRYERFIQRHPSRWWPFSTFNYKDLAVPVTDLSRRRPNDKLVVVLQQQLAAAATTPQQCACIQQEDTNRTTPTTERQILEEPSACIWAIIACCSPVNFHFRYGCFHYLSCTVIFWQVEPCQLPIILAATREAIQYYEQFTQRPVTSSMTTPVPAASSTVPPPTSTTENDQSVSSDANAMVTPKTTASPPPTTTVLTASLTEFTTQISESTTNETSSV